MDLRETFGKESIKEGRTRVQEIIIHIVQGS